MAVSCKTEPASRKDCSSAEAVAASIHMTLNSRANARREKQPDLTAFLPFVLSAGGVLRDDTEKAVAEWRKHVPPSEIGFMFNRIACALLNRRLARYSSGPTHDSL